MTVSVILNGSRYLCHPVIFIWWKSLGTQSLPLLGVLADGTVSIKSTDGSVNDFVINGGFISVSKNRVSILGEAQPSTN